MTHSNPTHIHIHVFYVGAYRKEKRLWALFPVQGYGARLVGVRSFVHPHVRAYVRTVLGVLSVSVPPWACLAFWVFWVGDRSFSKVFANGFVATEASRANYELIVHASESCVRALSGACGFIM